MSTKHLDHTALTDILENGSLDQVLKSTIGRKKSGVMKMHYLFEPEVSEGGFQLLSSVISYRFRREMTSTKHMVDDRPLVKELVGAFLPWTGLVESEDPVVDERYRLDGAVRAIVRQDHLVFMLKETTDSPNWSEGLCVFDLQKDKGTLTPTLSSRTGLKQIEVVELFQGYPHILEKVKAHLAHEYEYQAHPDGEVCKTKMVLPFEGTIASTIDIVLLGVVDVQPTEQ